MKVLNFIKNNVLYILIAIMVIVLFAWSAVIVAERDGSAAETTPGDILSGPLYENNEPMEIVTGPHRYFDIPLDKDLQDYIWAVCDEYHVDRTLVYAIIQRESNFNPKLIGDDGDSYGLMQVQYKWHEERMDLFNCRDLLDPYQNVRVGVDYLAELLSTGKSIHWVLMAYNGGRDYATEMESEGLISIYTQDVLKNKSELRTIRDEQ